MRVMRHSARLDFVDELSNWVKYRRGLCQGCWGGCCTLPLETSAADLIRLGWVTEEEAAVSLKSVARRLIREGKVRSFHPSRQIFTLEQTPNRDCRLMDPKTRLCTVYDRRPEVCRRFPSIGPKPGFCPKQPASC